jgi:hypothetical protein
MPEQDALAQARAKIEVQRAEAELRFSEQNQLAAALPKAESYKFRKTALYGHVFDRVISFARETYNAWLTMNRPVAELRDTLEHDEREIIDETFESKHPNRDERGLIWPKMITWKDHFRKTALDDLHDSPEWREIEERIQELAEWQAENGTCDNPINDSGAIDNKTGETGESETGASDNRTKPAITLIPQDWFDFQEHREAEINKALEKYDSFKRLAAAIGVSETVLHAWRRDRGINFAKTRVSAKVIRIEGFFQKSVW